MKLVYTEQAVNSLEDVLEFLAPKITKTKLKEIQDRILDAADTLLLQPLQGQEEPYLKHLALGHRRLIEGNYKLIYRIIDDCVYITDIFDSRQDPDRMKG